MFTTPFDEIKKLLSKKFPLDLFNKLPDKWEKVGDVLTIVLPPDLNKYKELVGEKYAKVLSCKSVLNDLGGIKGEYRKPDVELIFGSKNTETIHRENGIRYKLDPQKVMFSSGNLKERIRMATISNMKETVIDLFAGIGYFTLPIAVYSKPKKVFACEINPVAYNYLCENIVLNNVNSIVQPILGNNKEIAPKNVADRVILGYLENTNDFLETAISCLKNKKGVIHYHNVCPEKLFPDKLLIDVDKASEKNKRKAILLNHEYVKSYAPGIGHYVLDIRIG